MRRGAARWASHVSRSRARKRQHRDRSHPAYVPPAAEVPTAPIPSAARQAELATPTRGCMAIPVAQMQVPNGSDSSSPLRLTVSAPSPTARTLAWGWEDEGVGGREGGRRDVKEAGWECQGAIRWSIQKPQSEQPRTGWEVAALAVEALTWFPAAGLCRSGQSGRRCTRRAAERDGGGSRVVPSQQRTAS